MPCALPAAAIASDPIATSLVSPVVVATTTGTAPQLPAEVAVNTASGQQNESVHWNLTGYTFERTYQSYSVVGDVNGLSVTAQVQVVPPTSLYYVDSGMSASTPAFDAVSKALGGSLRNTVADQQVTGAATWGYLNDGNAYVAKHGSTSTDPYATGLYAMGAGTTSKPIVYDLPLEAGTYTVTAGFQEWWNNRVMNVAMVAADGTTTPIATGLAISGAPVTHAWPVTPIQGNVRLGVAALSYAGRLACTVHADAEALDARAVARALAAEFTSLGCESQVSARA